ncbi:MAG: glycosyltransferase family 4 protein [Bacteroidetes bacterium]|nr:glycosyltransferase family 4 protein [Bacteroidota bacterium]
MKNVTYIISDINKAISFEWIIERINNKKINLTFILINSNNSYLYQYLKKRNISAHLINCQSKKNIPLAVLKCSKILLKLKPDVVHCHLFMANIIGLISAKITGIKSRIYTRHHSDYHHVYFPKAVKWDKYCNFLATNIVSISDVVSAVLIEKEGVEKSKVTKIWHGFNTPSFTEPSKEKIQILVEKYNSNKKYPVIGVISRFIYLKGVQYVVPAYQKIIDRYPNALLLLFNAYGDYEKEIDELLSKLPQSSYQKITFENDITNLYKIFDVFVHAPISLTSEAFGQTYIESMLSGVPLIATKSGIGNEIMVNEFNCLEVPYKNHEAIYQALLKALNEETLKNDIIKNARESVRNEFSIQNMILKLEQLYLP